MRQQADAFQPPKMSTDWVSYATWEGLQVSVTSDARNDGNITVTCGDVVKVLTPSDVFTFSGAIVIESERPQILSWSRAGGGLIGSVFKPVGAPMEKPSRVWPEQVNGPVTEQQPVAGVVLPVLPKRKFWLW